MRFLDTHHAGFWRTTWATALLALGTAVAADDVVTNQPIRLQKQGSLYAGGHVLTGADGNLFHYDHLYASYQIPVKPRKYPLVMWHGCLSPAWESTPDDRPGFQSIFVHRDWSVYVIDQPRNGRAGRGLGGFTVNPAVPNEADSWTTFRMGVWLPPDPPTFFPGVQFPQDAASLEHYFKYGNSVNGPPLNAMETAVVPAEAVVALLDRIGPSVLVTHSAGGVRGFLTGTMSNQVKGIIAYEPAEFTFPEGELPPIQNTAYDGQPFSPGPTVPLTAFMNLTRMPVQIVYGDNIPTEPSMLGGPERWRIRLIYAQEFVDTINRHGGDAELLHLPDIGVYGNTHFPFFDLNNVEIADLMSAYLHEKGLDRKKDKN